MQKYIVRTINLMCCIVLSTSFYAQESGVYSFEEYVALFNENVVQLPTTTDSLLNQNLSECQLLDCETYNWFLFEGQKKRAQRCAYDGHNFNVTALKVACEPRTIAYGWPSKKITYSTKIYAIGYIPHEKYYIFIVRIECESNTYIDIYTYSRTGEILSNLCIYDDEGPNYIEALVESIYKFSTIMSDGTIRTEENRNSVNVKIDYMLMNDGIFKEVDVVKTGTYEIIDKDGYVNVREKPDSKSKILYTIESGTVIKATSQGICKWYEVISIEDDTKKGGYIHSSRLANYW